MDGWQAGTRIPDDVCDGHLQDAPSVRRGHRNGPLRHYRLPDHRISRASPPILARSAMTNTASRSAAFPWLGGRPTHLPCEAADVMPSVLLPGDPDRVSKAASVLDQVTEIGRRREFQMARGTWNGTPITVCSTGIGGPSTEIAVVELANLGMRRGIRVGGMGAIDPSM